jgi:hypothetical protein
VPNHCEGSRDAMMNIQITGTHKAGRRLRSLSWIPILQGQQKNDERYSAKEGGIDHFTCD